MAAALVASVTTVVAPTVAHADDPAPLRHFTMAFSGDELPHEAVMKQAWRYGNKQAYDFRPMFADIQPLLSGVDLAVCHMEVPVTPPGKKPTGWPGFGSPPEIVPALVWAGYDRCSTASNHTLDKGIDGVNATLNTFDQYGLGHSGTARSPQEAVAPILDVNGVKVVHLAYTFGFNQGRLKPEEQWRANKIDPLKIIADAADARQRGAEFVIVYLHWGQEKRSKPTKDQLTLANTLTASGQIDLIVGSHAHVLQPIDNVNGRWVVYGLGNSLSNQFSWTGWPDSATDGAIMTVSVDEQPGGGFSVSRPVVHPTFVQGGTYVILDVLKHQNDPLLKRYQINQLARSLKRTRKVLGPYVAP
jgi:poly-gamma-glutamate synthesis protein (capsule biosynthesis protein)